jgi:hypothetical protein
MTRQATMPSLEGMSLPGLADEQYKDETGNRMFKKPIQIFSLDKFD